MVIFVLAMVITILMTIASTKKVVFGWPENSLFCHRCPLSECTDKVQLSPKPSPDAERPKMYIYTFSEKTLRCSMADYPSALAHREPLFIFYPFAFVPF